ncbi:hypothetical protein AVEN_231079-1 [Araneus ventricosus]|uniref:Uncharacterized protein n=1 Tax=Araneus ventricosus TaxID=182803 RepID=A0A4Y2VEV8_ARAVE|nr:hypothetical protein AVEN_231079-1 [Araneus ventricosus]
MATLIPHLGVRWRCKQSHRVANGPFSIPRYHLYDYSCSHSKVKEGQHWDGHRNYQAKSDDEDGTSAAFPLSKHHAGWETFGP